MANLVTRKCKQSWKKYQDQDSILILLQAGDIGETTYHSGFHGLSFSVCQMIH